MSVMIALWWEAFTGLDPQTAQGRYVVWIMCGLAALLALTVEHARHW